MVTTALAVKKFPVLRDGADLELRPLCYDQLGLLRRWRNANKQWFFDSRAISVEDQDRWYREVYLNDPGDYLWIAHLEGVAFGTGALTHIDLRKREAEWSRLIVGEEWARGKGLAGRIARAVRDYGLDSLGLNRIYGSLWTANRVTMHIDMAAGYMPYKVEGNITHVELWRKDWRP